jgi:hypothetical protein
MDVDAAISNVSAGACMCGRQENVEYGPHPFGYGLCCGLCQREWSRMHGGERWRSNAEMLALLNAERSRATADGRGTGQVTDAWNRGLPPFERPAQTAKLSQQWKDEYEAYWNDQRASAETAKDDRA